MHTSKLRLLLALGLLVGCSSGPPWSSGGIVTALTYDDPDDWTTKGSCSQYLKTTCIAHHPDNHHHDGPHWFVSVTDENGNTRRVEVTETTHRNCRKGATWVRGYDGECAR